MLVYDQSLGTRIFKTEYNLYKTYTEVKSFVLGNCISLDNKGEGGEGV